MTVRIGITGPIGCGKSTVAGWLGRLGATVVDADEVARAVVEPGEPALDDVVAEGRRAAGPLPLAAGRSHLVGGTLGGLFAFVLGR